MTLETLEWVAVDGTVTVLQVRRPGLKGRLMPPIRRSSFTIPGQPGQFTRDVQHGPRPVVVPILIDGASPSAYRTALRAMARTLDPIDGDGMLRSTDVDGNVRELRCSYVDGFGGEEDWPVNGVPTLLFEADDPYWYDDTPTQIDWTLASSPASWFPIFPLRLSASEVFADASIDNTGDVQTYPIWTVQGPGSGLFVRELTTGKALSVTRVLGVGESLTIDTRPRINTIQLQDGTNLWPLAAGSMWPLIKGVQAIRVELTGATVASLVSLRYWRRFLSA